VSRENVSGGRVRRVRRWAGRLAVPAIALAFLAVPLSGLRGRLTVGCAEWTAIAAGLEALSVLGFLLVFDLVFGRRLSRRQSLGAGLRAVGATTLLPAGTLIGPAVGARSASARRAPAERLSRATVMFAVLTTLPGVIVLGGAGFSLWVGWLSGPLGSLLPLPLGIGAVEGGLIGALALYGAPLLPAAGAVLLYRGISLLVPVALSACAWAVVPLAGVSGRSARARSPKTSWRFLRRTTVDRLGRSHS
jgi:hypothetical protein